MSRFPQIQTGPGTWRVVAKGPAIIILTSIKCHFSPRIFPTAIEFQVRIVLICWRVDLVLDFMLFWIEEPNNNLLSTLSIFSAQWCFIFNVCKNVHFAFYTSKRESFKVAKHFRTAHVPAAERFHTWKYRGIKKHSFHTFSILKTHNSSRKVMFRWRKFFCGMELPPGAP